MAKPLVAVVGRPNVGKSTLFNAIVNKRISIVEDIPGVTRDRIYFDAEWLNREFTMIDTGGIEFITDNSHVIPKMMRLQAELAIEEADVILFVVDGKQGIVPADEEVANILRASGKPVVLVVNKIDSVNQEPNIYEFYNLGLGDPIGISAKNLMNLGDLLDDTVKHFPPVGTNVDDEDTIIMDYDDGMTASFVLTTGEACHEERLEIIGTKAKLLLEDNTLTITRHQDVEEYINSIF